MKLVQYTSGLSTLLFMVKIYTTKSFEAQMDCFLAVIILVLIFILTSHYIGMANLENDIADEIKKNHFDKLNKRKRSSNLDNI
jgi:multisubunit Na+/H+ antiporter MnhG subunit